MPSIRTACASTRRSATLSTGTCSRMSRSIASTSSARIPVYGLNALGGAVIVNMKNGFTYQGGESEISGRLVGHDRRLIPIRQERRHLWRLYRRPRARRGRLARSSRRIHVQQLYADLGVARHALTARSELHRRQQPPVRRMPTPIQELAVDRALDLHQPANQQQRARIRRRSTAATRRTTRSRSRATPIAANSISRSSTATPRTTRLRAAPTACCASPMARRRFPAPAASPSPISRRAARSRSARTIAKRSARVSLGGALQPTYTGALFGHDNNLVARRERRPLRNRFQFLGRDRADQRGASVESSGYFVVDSGKFRLHRDARRCRREQHLLRHLPHRYVRSDDALSLTASGRLNLADVDISDRIGSALSGDNRYDRFDPALGATYKLAGISPPMPDTPKPTACRRQASSMRQPDGTVPFAVLAFRRSPAESGGLAYR